LERDEALFGEKWGGEGGGLQESSGHESHDRTWVSEPFGLLAVRHSGDFSKAGIGAAPPAGFSGLVFRVCPLCFAFTTTRSRCSSEQQATY
jgi:hypothetical protein